MKRKLILSPCGTSLFTNRKTLFEGDISKDANMNENELPSEKLDDFLKTIMSIEDELMKADRKKRRKMSAEINALYALEPNGLRSDTVHLLIETDTFFGQQTARIIKELLENEGVQNVQIIHIGGLRTRELSEFRFALADLVKKLDETLPGYRKSDYEIVFNLTGGFKSIQGFLQSVAPFYADRSIYIFEKSDELLTIPSLPVVQGGRDVIEQHISIFRRLFMELPCSKEDVQKLPAIYWWEVEGEYALTEWGILAFQKAKESLYEARLFEPPTQKIEIPPKVLKKLETMLDKKRKKEFNGTMDDLARDLETGQSLKSSTFKKIAGKPKEYSTYECYLNSDNAERIYCHYENDKLVIDEVGKHL